MKSLAIKYSSIMRDTHGCVGKKINRDLSVGGRKDNVCVHKEDVIEGVS